LVDNLGLNEIEKQIFIRMVGRRYNVGKKEIKFTADRFANRIENKRFLIYQLERLVSECKSLAAQHSSSTQK
jgi:hypothetical protein